MFYSNLSKTVALAIGVLAMVFLIGYFVFAWTEPTQAPPGGNVPAPINVGDDTQYKSGALGIGGLFQTDGETHLAITGGNVGIGTTAPNNLIQVKDLINFDNSQYNTVLGYRALLSYTPGIGENTAVGYQALRDNTTGHNNTALGFNALRDNTTGFKNTAVGNIALRYNTGGDENTALGQAALLSNTTGNHNTAVGETALYFNADGHYNTAVGHNSLFNNTTGNENTALGYGTLDSNTTGGQNIAVGHGADVSSSNLTNATVIGSNAVVTQSNAVRIGNDSVTWIGGNVAWSPASDKRVKEDIQECDLGLDFIKGLRPISFVLKNDEEKIIRYGFIAQEVEELLGNRKSEIVTTDNSPEHFKYTAYTSFIAPLVNAVQEQQKQIEELKAEIQRLNGSNL